MDIYARKIEQLCLEHGAEPASLGGWPDHKRVQWLKDQKVDIPAPTLDDLQTGDYIAFAWHDGRDFDIIVENITSIAEHGHVLMHFMNGFKSESEYVKPENIIAIGDQIAGPDSIPFWKGKFHILLPEHPVLVKQQSSARGCPSG